MVMQDPNSLHNLGIAVCESYVEPPGMNNSYFILISNSTLKYGLHFKLNKKGIQAHQISSSLISLLIID